MENTLKTYPTDGKWMSAYRWKVALEKELRRIKELEEGYPKKDKNYAETLAKELLDE